jgi:hypothetical protein
MTDLRFDPCKICSDATLGWLIGADESDLEEVELPTTVYLALHELELCDFAAK